MRFVPFASEALGFDSFSALLIEAGTTLLFLASRFLACDQFIQQTNKHTRFLQRLPFLGELSKTEIDRFFNFGPVR
jgi:hypothetical protein